MIMVIVFSDVEWGMSFSFNGQIIDKDQVFC